MNLMRILIMIIVSLYFSQAIAQWNSNTEINTLVVDSEGGDMKAIGAGDGKTYVVFWKSVAAPVNYELRMQVLDVDGNKTLGNDGLLISNTIPMSTFTVIWNIAVDDANNIYIGVTGTGGGDPAYVFKLDTAGNHLWNSNGVNVGSGNLVTILPLSSGDALVSWLSSSGGLMQKFDSNGMPVWPSDQPIENGSSTTAPANFFEISNDNYIAVFHTLIGGINSYMWAQRYDANGVAVWANPVQLADRATAFNRSYTGVKNGDVVYMGYSLASAIRFDSYVQRVNPDGSLPWGINGSDFDTNETDYEISTTIAMNPGSQYVWAVCTYTDSSQNQRGESVQKFDKDTGARQFTDNGKVVYAIGEEKVHAGTLFLKNDSPIFLIKDGVDNGATPTTLHVLYLDDNGEFFWPEELRPVATYAANKSRINYTTPVNNQSVAVFIEDKGSGSRIYAQNFIDEVLGIDDHQSSNLLFVFNNPVEDILTIKSNRPIEKLELYNSIGQQVILEEVHLQEQLELSMESLSGGYYILEVYFEDTSNKAVGVIKQ